MVSGFDVIFNIQKVRVQYLSIVKLRTDGAGSSAELSRQNGEKSRESIWKHSNMLARTKMTGLFFLGYRFGSLGVS